MHAMDNRELSEREKRILQWLRDKNLIQRTIIKKPSGKRIVTEQDVSGGLAAFIRLLLDFERPLHPQIREALAAAVDPAGSSILQLKKRLRRRPGRPSKTGSVESAVLDAYEVHSSEIILERKRRELQNKRPQPAAGMKRSRITTKETIKGLEVGRSKNFKLRRRLKQFRDDKSLKHQDK
jgi:hypothetical protein